MSIALSVSDAFAIENFNDLINTIEGWLDRDDLSDKIPHFIYLAEARFNRLLRTPEMETWYPVATTNSTVALPTDYLGIRFVYLTTDNCRYTLQQVTPVDMANMNGRTDEAPRFYSVNGRRLQLFPTRNANLEIHYYQRIPPLTQNVANNWLLDTHPDIYLLGALVQAEAYIDNPDQVALWKSGLDEALGELIDLGLKQKWGNAPLAPMGHVTQVAGGRA